MGAGPDPYAAGGTDSRPRLPEPTTPGGSRSRQGGLYRQGWGVAGREGAVDTAAEPLPGAEAGKELREAAGAGGGGRDRAPPHSRTLDYEQHLCLQAKAGRAEPHRTFNNGQELLVRGQEQKPKALVCPCPVEESQGSRRHDPGEDGSTSARRQELSTAPARA